MIAPPSVKHIRYSRGDDLPSIASACANAIHLSKGESALLKYYACQSSGFRPSLQHIADQTGLSRSQVARCRNGLVSKGLCLAVLGNKIGHNRLEPCEAIRNARSEEDPARCLRFGGSSKEGNCKSGVAV